MARTISNLNKSQKEIINDEMDERNVVSSSELIENIDFDLGENIIDRIEALEQGAAGSEDLLTNNKTIVGAINELFQSANNGKQLIASAIGSPLSSNDTFSAMSNDINSLLSTFKINMMNNGVTVNSGDKFKQLIDKIVNITGQGSGKGIQFEMGTDTINIIDGGSAKTKTVSGLKFIPTYVFCFVQGKVWYEDKELDVGYTIRDLVFGSVGDTYWSNGLGHFKVSISGNSFTIKTYLHGSVYEAVGETPFTWYAIGVAEEDTTLRDSLASILQEEGVTVTEEDNMANLISKVDEEFNEKNNEITDMKQDLKDVLVNKGVDVGGADDITSLLNKVNDLNVVNTPNFAMNYSIGNFTPFKNPNEREFAYKVPVYCNGKVYYMHLAQNANTANFSVDLNTMAVTTGLNASNITAYAGNNYRFDTNYCVFGTDIYLIGGKTGVNTTKWNTNWCYNTLNNTWTAKKARPAEVSNSDVVRCNNRIYTINTATNSYYYTPSSDTWTQISVGFFGKILVAKDNNTIYGFSGKDMYILNTQTNISETKSNTLTVSLAFGSTGVYLKDHIYILQGNYIYRIDPSTGLIDGQSNRLYNAAKMYKYNDTCAIIMDYMGNGWIFEP